ncbi:putative quinol monooxygenase [Marinicella sp. W31]|uniref:putative quinol monooxygenase n=1 Tax=Marinicella sp. W31 TaxID=3023713 RepID=UPI00375841BB
MYGLISQMLVVPGQREALIDILMQGTRYMPGCLNYIISKDAADEHTIWITEVWDSRESHQASLRLPTVQEAITTAKPMIAGFGQRIETEPVGGQDLN